MNDLELMPTKIRGVLVGYQPQWKSYPAFIPIQSFPIPPYDPTAPEHNLPDEFGEVVWRVRNEAEGCWSDAHLTSLTSLSSVAASRFVLISPRDKVSSPAIAALVLLKPSSGKSESVRLANEPLINLDSQLFADRTDAHSTHFADTVFWGIKQRELIKHAAVAANGPDKAKVHKMLKELKDKEPKLDLPMPFLHFRMTISALLDLLDGEGKFAALAADEGGIMLDDDLVAMAHYLCKIYDYGYANIARGNRRNLNIAKASLTLLLKPQPGIFDLFSIKDKKRLLDSGFFHRMLVATPMHDPLLCARVNSARGKVELSAFHKRILELAIESRNNSGAKPIPLTFSGPARDLWLDYSASARVATLPGGVLFDAPELGAKNMENLNRIATLYHVYQYQEKQISRETLEYAFAAVKRRNYDWLKLFPTVRQTDAQILEQYLHEQRFLVGNHLLHNFHLQSGPKCLRNGPKFHAAMNVLISQNKVGIAVEETGAHWIVLNDQYFSMRSN